MCDISKFRLRRADKSEWSPQNWSTVDCGQVN